MKSIIDFLQDILMIKKTDTKHVGLSGFKMSTHKPLVNNCAKLPKKKVSISDLMRGAV